MNRSFGEEDPCQPQLVDEFVARFGMPQAIAVPLEFQLVKLRAVLGEGEHHVVDEYLHVRSHEPSVREAAHKNPGRNIYN